jgi:hypothetical protein
MTKTIVTDLAGWQALPELQLPAIESPDQQGSTYMVKKVGFLAVPESELTNDLRAAKAELDRRLLPTAVVDFNGQDTLCRLPLGLSDWAQYCVGAALSLTNPFPSEVEFGVLRGRAYAEFKL